MAGGVEVFAVYDDEANPVLAVDAATPILYQLIHREDSDIDDDDREHEVVFGPVNFPPADNAASDSIPSFRGTEILSGELFLTHREAEYPGDRVVNTASSPRFLDVVDGRKARTVCYLNGISAEGGLLIDKQHEIFQQLLEKFFAGYTLSKPFSLPDFLQQVFLFVKENQGSIPKITTQSESYRLRTVCRHNATLLSALLPHILHGLHQRYGEQLGGALSCPKLLQFSLKKVRSMEIQGGHTLNVVYFPLAGDHPDEQFWIIDLSLNKPRPQSRLL